MNTRNDTIVQTSVDAPSGKVAAVRDYRGSLRATWTDTGTGASTGGSGTKGVRELTGYYPYGLPWADWQGEDRWLYGGKEFEREHSLLTYDYHASPYDPGLCRFTAPDPLAAKYERLN